MKKLFTKENLLKAFYSFIWISLLVFVIDIVSKWCVQTNLLNDGASVTLIPNFLHVTLSHNKGASFGMGSNGDISWRIFWIVVSVIMSAILIFVYIKYSKKFNRLQTIALTLMIGGAIGNMIDRIFYWEAIVGFDGVVDWIDFQFGKYHFPTFNIADSALVIGVFILIIYEIYVAIKEAIAKGKRGEYDIAPNEIKEDGKDQDK